VWGCGWCGPHGERGARVEEEEEHLEEFAGSACQGLEVELELGNIRARMLGAEGWETAASAAAEVMGELGGAVVVGDIWGRCRSQDRVVLQVAWTGKENDCAWVIADYPYCQGTGSHIGGGAGLQQEGQGSCGRVGVY
jgi:hypothetical protein